MKYNCEGSQNVLKKVLNWLKLHRTSQFLKESGDGAAASFVRVGEVLLELEWTTHQKL